MANTMYTKALQGFLEGQIAWLTDNIKVVLVDNGAYTVALTTHQFLSDIPAGARIATSANLTGKTSTDGVANANSAVFTAASGVQSEACVIYKDTGVATTSRLIYYMDTMTGLPVTPNGGDITLGWDTGPNKIFKFTP